MNNRKIPQTDSVQELAQFWDTHDLTDFEDQLEEVTEPVFARNPVVQIQLQPEELEAVEEMATSKGMGSAALIREWIRERIHLS